MWMGVAGGICAAQAKTVAWWRFQDLGEAGGTATADLVFTNCVDAAKFPAKPCSFSAYAKGTTAAYMPVLGPVTNATQALRVVDPVGGTTNTVAGAMTCPWGGNGTKLSGGAYVESTPELYGADESQTGDFTFECFFRTSAASISRSANMVAIAGMRSPNVMGAWCLMVYQQKLWTRAAVSGANGASSQVSGGGSTVVTPDVWHHAAFVYNQTERKVRIYLDYALQQTLTMTSEGTGRINPSSSTEPIYLGKSMAINEDRSLAGDMAEARISDAALSPDQFLSFLEDSKGDRVSDDPDLIAWYSLDSEKSLTSFMGANSNLKRSGILCRFISIVQPDSAPAASFAEGNVRAASVRASMDASSPEQTNVASFAALAGSPRNAYLTFDDSMALTNGSFTQEFAFRTAHPVIVTGGNDYTNSYCLVNSSYCKMLVNQASHGFFCRFKGVNGDADGEIAGGRVADDGAWHHVAFVYDATIPRASCYYDGELVKTVDGALVGRPDGTTHVLMGYSTDGGGQNFDGWIDEVRFTRRVLRAEEFLAFNARLPANTILRGRFENSLRLEPYDTIEPCTAAFVKGSPSTPGFTSPRSPAIDLSDEGNEQIPDTQALAMAGTEVSWPRFSALERRDFTVEFFWRPYEKFAPWPVVLGIANSADGRICDVAVDRSLVNTPWAFYYRGSWAQSALQLNVMTTNYLDGVLKTNSNDLTVSPMYTFTGDNRNGNPGYGAVGDCDEKWHHVAATFESVDVDGTQKIRATAFWDYTRVGTMYLSGDFNWTYGACLVMARNSQNLRLATWDFDELRISKGVLAPSQFIHPSHVGTLILIR